jgi:hypothetical protein
MDFLPFAPGAAEINQVDCGGQNNPFTEKTNV